MSATAKVNLVPMPESDGGADFSLVELDQYGKPSCREHGAMNKVSPVFWRCIALAGPKKNPCRAGCMVVDALHHGWVSEETSVSANSREANEEPPSGTGTPASEEKPE